LSDINKDGFLDFNSYQQQIDQSEIPAELVVSLDLDKRGPLIRGITGIDGNIPKLDQSALPVTVCTDQLKQQEGVDQQLLKDLQQYALDLQNKLQI
jgi:hypothetical protein